MAGSLQFERAAALFLEARPLGPEDRDRIMQAADRENPAVGELLRRLLANDRQDTPFLQTPLRITEGSLLGSSWQDGAFELGQPLEDNDPGKRPTYIGRYEVTKTIGVGGMGAVYLARQESPPRMVAVKVIRPGVLSNQVERRFQHEVELLGRLQHPGIAQIHEAGVGPVLFAEGTSAHCPFFAMEFVQGEPLLEFAANHGMGARARLELFARVCDAVHHAHLKGVIHRDLKPANILVDKQGQPKVLDFGVARAIDADVQAVSVETSAGQLVGTIPYMSPEQVAGDVDQLDIRCDVYALGVILYELLAGDLPYRARGCSVPQAIRAIREDEPQRLGTVHRSLRGDIEIIVHKALEKDKPRRYQSAAELAADIRRFLADEPIVARPPSALYQIRKFAKRSRALFAGLAVAALALTSGTGVAAWQAIRATGAARRAMAAQSRATQEQHRAEEALDDAEASIEFLTSMLSSADPDALGREVLVRDVLDAAVKDVENKWADRPLIEARVRDAIGQTYHALGDLAQGEKHLQWALKIQRAIRGPEDPITLGSAHRLVQVYSDQGRYDEAAALQAATLAARRPLLGSEHPDTARSSESLGTIYFLQGKHAQAEPYLVEALEVYRRALGLDHKDTLNALSNVGTVNEGLGRLAEAEGFFREAIAGYEATQTTNARNALTALNGLARNLWKQGRRADAEPYFRDVLERRRAMLGPAHPSTLMSMSNLAVLLGSLGKLAEAEPYYLEVLAGRRRTLGDEHPLTLHTLDELGDLRFRQGRYEEAGAYSREALNTRRRVLGPDHPDTLGSMVSMARLLEAKGRYEEAERTYRDAWDGHVRVLGADHPDTLTAMCNLGVLLALEQKLGEAEELLQKSLADRRRTLGENHPDTVGSKAALAKLREMQD